MSAVVIKLGSSIVADDEGQPRADVLAHVCEQAAALHRAGRDVAIVTSGAIARGMGVMRFPERPRAIDELQAASERSTSTRGRRCASCSTGVRSR